MQVKLGLTISIFSIGLFSSQIKTGKKIGTVQFQKSIGSVHKKGNIKTIAKNCSEFPFKVGCKNIRILELQKCLGLPQDGVFGARTLKMLKDYANDLPDNMLTFEIWNNITSSCKDSNDGGLHNIDSGNTQNIDLSNEKGDPELPPNKFYRSLLNSRQIDTEFGSDGSTLVRYNGPELSESDLKKLDTAMDEMNFIRTTDTIRGTYLFKRK